MTPSHIDKLRHLAETLMHSPGMPSLVINAPEDKEDQWYIYPGKQAAIGTGPTLEAAIDDAMNHPQIPAMTDGGAL